jgi:histidine triad (HIT) family protein
MESCLFCRVAAGEIPAKKRYEDEEMLAFDDISPAAPAHILLIPKKHIATLMDAAENDAALLGRLLFRAQLLAKEAGCEERGARFVINCKEDGCQSVPHLHLHNLGGRKLAWPPG